MIGIKHPNLCIFLRFLRVTHQKRANLCFAHKRFSYTIIKTYNELGSARLNSCSSSGSGRRRNVRDRGLGQGGEDRWLREVVSFLRLVVERLVVVYVPPFLHQHLDVLSVHVRFLSGVPPWLRPLLEDSNKNEYIQFV